MSCSEPRVEAAFAVWLTGLPSSGKSTIAERLIERLHRRGIDVARLESDALRPILTPNPSYTPEERDHFYRALVEVGGLLVDHGVPVVIDATANRQRYRDRARKRFARFAEVFVDCPVAICEQRDVKGLYRRARAGDIEHVPGVDAPYERPPAPECRVDATATPPDQAAATIVNLLIERDWIDPD